MHVVVGGARDFTRLFLQCGFCIGQLVARGNQIFLHAHTQLTHLLAGLAGGEAQQLLGIGDNRPEVGNQLFLRDDGLW